MIELLDAQIAKVTTEVATLKLGAGNLQKQIRELDEELGRIVKDIVAKEGGLTELLKVKEGVGNGE